MDDGCMNGNRFDGLTRRLAGLMEWPGMDDQSAKYNCPRGWWNLLAFTLLFGLFIHPWDNHDIPQGRYSLLLNSVGFFVYALIFAQFLWQPITYVVSAEGIQVRKLFRSVFIQRGPINGMAVIDRRQLKDLYRKSDWSVASTFTQPIKIVIIERGAQMPLVVTPRDPFDFVNHVKDAWIGALDAAGPSLARIYW